MPINENDPLGIGGGINLSNPLGIEGPIQKMKPTGPSISPWSPTIGQRFEMASPSLFGSQIQPATGMPEGLVTRGLNAVQSLMTHAPFAQQTEPDPTQPNLIPGTPPQGFSAFVNPFLQQVNLQNAVLAGVLPQLFAAKMASPVVNATKAGVSALFGAQGAEQAGQAFGRASVQGIPDLGLSPGGPEMTVVGPVLKKMGLNTNELVPTGQGTTEQWENLANEILGLAQVAGATVGPHALGREQVQPSMGGPNRYVSGEMQHGSPEMPFMMPNRPGIPMEDKPQFYETPPLIGERPLTIEQPIIRPGGVNPQDPLQIKKGIGFSGEPKQGGQISFQGQGIPSAMQSKATPKGEQSEQAALMRGGFVPSTKEGRLQSGLNPDDILPAINLGGKLLIGRQGDTHADILERNGIDPQAVSHPDPARGFVNSKTGQFLSRLEAQKQSGIVGTAKAGGLDSMDLPGAAKVKVMRNSGFSDSEIRETLGSKLQSGLNYDNLLPGGKDDPMFPILTRIQDAGYETLYSEHGMGEGDSTPYVVFKRTTAEKDARIKEAAKVVGAEVEERPKRIGVYLKESDKVEDIKKDWESFTKHLGSDTKLQSGLWTGFESDKEKFPHLLGNVNQGQAKAVADGGVGIHDDYPILGQSRERWRYDPRRHTVNWDDEPYKESKQAVQDYLAARGLDVKGLKHKNIFTGERLYSGLPIFDEKLWRSKDKVEKEQEESVKLGLGKQPITSLPLDPDPESVNKTTTKLNSGLIPALTGYGVDRPLNEVIEAFAGKQAGWSAPRHIAANEELGNALVRVAASDIASVMESKASSPAVAASYKQNTFKLLYDAYINSGFGQPVVKGVPAPVMSGKPMELVHINKKPLWIRSDLEPEFSQALQTDSRVRKAGAALLMDLATELQVIGLTDFVFHGANMFGSIAYDLGAKTTEGDLVRGTVPGARHIDAMMRIGHEMRRVILDDPAVRRELADISKIGALRAEEQGQSLISRTPVVGKYIDMGHWIQLFDKAGRLARNKMFDNLVDRKLIKDTELDRREFINKMGQYNARLMSKFQDFQRQYVSQFVVAGRTFNRNAFQRVFMSNQARALNPAAYAKMKALNAASLFSALLVTPVVFNMWTTGKPFGRKGTDIGSVDTGKDDENGRPIQIDILQTTLLRRGFRNLGLQALQKGVRAGKDFGTTATDMGRDVANGLIHPWAGPPIRAGWTAITGKSVGFGGFPLSKDTDSLTDNFLAGLAQVNPMVAAAYDKSVKGDKADGYFQRTAAAVGFKKGPFPTHEDALEKETGKKVGEMSLGERVQAEKSHKEKAEKLPPETKAKAAERSIANITKRGEELSKQMTKADRQWMESRGLNVPGFDNKIHAGKTLVYLTKDEMERLSKYTLEAYNEAMPEVRQKYPQLGDNSKDVYFNARMSAARGKARARLIQELNSQNESNQEAKKRFTVFDNE